MADTLDDLFCLTAIAPGGETLDLAGWFPAEGEGFGTAPFHRLRQRGPQQQGETDCGFRLEGRTFSFRCKLRAGSPSELYARREQLLRVFAPTESPLRLRLTLPGGELREIDCYLEKGISFSAEARRGLVQEVEICLYAPDPTLYDPAVKRAVWSWDAASHLSFPAAFPWLFGEGWQQAEQAVLYAGSWRASPRIIFCGPLSSPSLQNLGTGSSISLDYTLSLGETMTVDTRYGSLPASSNWGEDLSGKLNPFSDLTGFCLSPGSSATANVFRAGGAAGQVEHTQIILEWNDRYIGI